MSGYVQTWHELVCPKCKSSNFVNAGDMNDATGFDPEDCCCWKCKHCFDFEGNAVEDEDAQELCDTGIRLIEKRKGKVSDD